MAMKISNELKKQLEFLIYKILFDVLFLWVIVFLGLLILEGLVPGYFSAYLSFTKMILFLSIILGLIGYLGRKNQLISNFSGGKSLFKRKSMIFLLIICSFLVINSARSLAPIALIICVVSISAIIYLLFNAIFLEEK